MMKKKGVTAFLVLLCILMSGKFLGLPAAVTYDFSGGRFGDCLLSYCHAKWIAHIHKMPLLYKPFEYSKYLMMDLLEMPYAPELAEQFDRTVLVDKETIFDRESGTLYIVPFFPESIFNRHDTVFPYLFTVDWRQKEFKQELQRMIRPINPCAIPEIPAGMISVAVHVRRGTGWDIPNYRITPAQLTASHPLRFAPDSFYISQLKRIIDFFPGAPIFAYLFTDHNDPQALADQYQAAVKCPRMIIKCRQTENNEFVNVLDDFFALTHFDCLIRPDSNFSYVSSKVADHKLIIAPWHGTVTGEQTLIDEISIELLQEFFVLKEQH